MVLLTFGPRELNSAENITDEVAMERFFFFLAIERDTFSILSNVDFTVVQILHFNSLMTSHVNFNIKDKFTDSTNK